MKTIILFSTLAVLGFGTYGQKTQKDSATNYINLWIKQNTERAITGTIMNAALNKMQRGIIDTAYYSGDSLYIAQNGAARFLRRDSWKKTGNYVSNTNASNVGINTTAPDSALSVMGGILGTGGVRFTGLPSAAGTKALRYNPGTGNISYADTASGGEGGTGSYTFSKGLYSAAGNVGLGQPIGQSGNPAALSENREVPLNNYAVEYNQYPSRTILRKDGIDMYFDSSLTGYYPLVFNAPDVHSDHVPFLFNMSKSSQPPYTGDNNVMMFGWNIGNGGSNYIPGKPGIGFSLESNWHPDGDPNVRYVESHEFYLKPNGTQVRLKSYTIGTPPGTEFIDLYHTTDGFHLRDTALHDYLITTSSQTTDRVNFTLTTPNTSKGFAMVMQPTGMDISLTGYSGVSGKQVNFINCEKILLPGMTFSVADNFSTATSDLYGNAKKSTGWNWVSAGQIGGNKGYFSANPGAGIHNWVARANLEIVANTVASGASLTDNMLAMYKENFTTFALRVQNNGAVTVGHGTIESSAALQIIDTARGVLPPRMTKTQRDAIASPASGLTIYQTDNTPGIRVYNGTNWMRFTETAD